MWIETENLEELKARNKVRESSLHKGVHPCTPEIAGWSVRFEHKLSGVWLLCSSVGVR